MGYSEGEPATLRDKRNGRLEIGFSHVSTRLAPAIIELDLIPRLLPALAKLSFANIINVSC